MSLETLLEAAEFLEWSKTGKKSSRATRTSRKAEKFKPYSIIKQKKGKSPASKSSSAKAASASVASHSNVPVEEPGTITIIQADEDVGGEDHLDIPEMAMFLQGEQSQARPRHITFKEIKKNIGTRETHNKLEKNRRAHLKECFEELRGELPMPDERRSSNLATLRSALRLIDQLNVHQRELETEKRRMHRLKNTRQAQINMLRKDLEEKGVEYNIEDWIERSKTSTNSTSTASECGEMSLETLNAQAQALTAMMDTHTTTARTSTGEEIQLVIKTVVPPQQNVIPVTNTAASSQPKSAAVVTSSADLASGRVTVQAPTQAIQMIHQAAIKAGAYQQVHKVKVPTRVYPSASVGTGVHASPQQQQRITIQQITPRESALQVASPIKLHQGPAATQVLAVAKLAHGTAQQKLLLTQKKPGTVAQAGINTISPKNLTAISAPMLVPNTNLVVTQVPSQSVMSGPITVNLNSGARVITQTQQVGRQQPAILTLANQPQFVHKPATELQSNMQIAPKQLLLITPSDQSKLRQGVSVTSTGALTQITHTGNLNAATALMTPGQQHSVLGQHKVISSSAAGPSTQLIPITNLNQAQAIAVAATSQNIARGPKPTIITGMLPTTAPDGTVSYVPVQLTTKPVPTTDPNVSVQASAIPATPTAQLVNGGKGITLLLPPGTGATSNTGNALQVVKTSNQFTPQTMHIATTQMTR